VNVAARTSAMLWIWSLGSLATGVDPITRARGCSRLSAVPCICIAGLSASSPSLFPATPLLLSPVDAPCPSVPPIARVAWRPCDEPGTLVERLVPPVPLRCAGLRCVRRRTHRAVCRSQAANATRPCTRVRARASERCSIPSQTSPTVIKKR
jgi:hypothetical protein